MTLFAACAVFAGGESALRPRIVGFDITGEPDGLDMPIGVLPSIPILYSTGAARLAGQAVARFLAQNGYPYSQITVSVVREGADVILRFSIDPDERVCFGPPVVVGVREERAGMFLRDVRLTPGLPYDVSAVDDAVRRLSARPYVQSAAAMDPVVIEDGLLCCGLADAGPCIDTSLVAVVPIAVTERRGTEIEGAVGYEAGRDGKGGRWSGRFNLSLINMARRGEMFDVFYSGADALQKLRISGSAPWIFGLPVEAGASGGLEIENGGYGYFSGEVWGAAEAGGGRWRCGVAAKGSETVPPDSAAGSTYRFYGADIFLSLTRLPWERGLTVWELNAKTGSGAANREKPYLRSNMELSAGVHRPVFKDYAMVLRAAASSMFTEEEYLMPAELYRVGGHGSLRGYSEEEFAFRAVVFAQAEALYYFRRQGAVFIFVDGGAGFAGRFETLRMSDAGKMLGYGLGLRFPSGLGTVSLEWARNIDDGKSLGRVHVGIRTSVR
ncbi:MAG: BamA/TamA family outer membrane protein [Chitinispirillia bacterium]|nr:BamA/TamA family outer membrane protein [Chitinispirillia bacterium]MCL2240895.1 BamA/TamA family outer membrane protein [Chitinispirillia bacterium]